MLSLFIVHAKADGDYCPYLQGEIEAALLTPRVGLRLAMGY